MNDPHPFQVHVVTPTEAQTDGFAKYNGGPHLAIELPEGHSTLTVKTCDGKLVTLAFCKSPHGPHPQCVDLKQHSAPDEAGKPMPLRCNVMGQGPTLFAVARDGSQPDFSHAKGSPATLISLNFGD